MLKFLHSILTEFKKKIDVFYAAGKLTEAEYNELISLLHN